MIARRWPTSALLLCAALAACKKSKPTPPPAVTPEVLVSRVEVRDTPIDAEVTGEIRGGEDVEVRARVSGFLQSINYSEGSLVRKGELLFTIDPKPFQAAVSRAAAEVAEARARHDRAIVQVNRLRPLVVQHAVAQQELDNALTAEESGRAAIAAAEAELTTARLDLSYTRITSPISGLAGTRQVDVGSYVGEPQPTVLAVVSALDPVRFDFNISETEYLMFARAAKAAGRTLLESAKDLELELADGSVHPYKGRLTVVGRGISTETSTLPMQAMFPNPSGLLKPGQFGRLTLRIATRPNSIVIPQRAVQELQGTYNVYVVRKDSVAEVREIKVANRIAEDWVVASGLQPSDRIVIEGLQKVKGGGKVRPTKVSVAAGDKAP